MDYIKLTCAKPQNEVLTDILMADLGMAGFESFEETEECIYAYIPQKDYHSGLIDNIDFHTDIEPKTEVIKDQNWNAVWESNYPPVLIAGRCYIYAPFHEKRPDVEFNIAVKPKMAFGTAHHETTAQMIALMLDEDFKKKEVLDMGCGTGVLAILASMKGAKHVDAVDIDTWSYNNTEENCQANHITNITAVLGDVRFLENKKEHYDVILANINKNILLADMPAYSRALKTGGKIFFSGFYNTDLDDLKTKAASVRLSYNSHRTQNKWVAAIFSKK